MRLEGGDGDGKVKGGNKKGSNFLLGVGSSVTKVSVVQTVKAKKCASYLEPCKVFRTIILCMPSFLLMLSLVVNGIRNETACMLP